jgi:hypothetical protein
MTTVAAPVRSRPFHAPAPSAKAEVPTSLDALLLLDAPALRALYEGARAPRLSDVTGPLRGRMLVVPAVTGSVARAIRAFASSDAFPWRGKSFTRKSEHRGDGINRVIRDRWTLYRFETFIGKSLAGDFDAVQLDYDLADNPFFIRPIRDEIREIGPGLYLGQAYWQTAREAHLVLYFALAKNVP